MNSRLFRIGVAASLSLAAGAAIAHHSIGGEFDSKQQVTVEGVVKEFHLINPHAYILVEFRQDDGTLVQWTLSMGPATKLVRGSGWTPTTLKPGDKVKATGRPARRGKGMYVLKLTDAHGTDLITKLQK